MPIYEYICEHCGPFEQRRAIAEAGDPMACSSCGREARRVYSVANTRKIPTGLSGAMDRAEKSAHEPGLVRRLSKGEHPSSKKPKRGHGRPWTLGH